MTHPMTVMAVNLLIWIGVFLYLACIEARVRKLERRKDAASATQETEGP